MESKPWTARYDPQIPTSLAPYPSHGFHEYLEQSAARYPDSPCGGALSGQPVHAL